MRHGFVSALPVAALAAVGVLFAQTAQADDAAAFAGAGGTVAAVAAERSAGVLSFLERAPRRNHQHSVPRVQSGRTPIRGHGHAFVSASIDRRWNASADHAHGFARN